MEKIQQIKEIIDDIRFCSGLSWAHQKSEQALALIAEMEKEGAWVEVPEAPTRACSIFCIMNSGKGCSLNYGRWEYLNPDDEYRVLVPYKGCPRYEGEPK